MFVRKGVSMGRSRLLSLVFSVFCLGFLSGCVSGPKYWVLVENKGKTAIKDVRVALDGEARYESELINAGVLRGFKPELKEISADTTLQWTDHDGTEHSFALKKDELSESFEGYLYFLVGRDQQVRIYKKAVQAERAEGPWVRPAEWEGTVNLPGVSP